MPRMGSDDARSTTSRVLTVLDVVGQSEHGTMSLTEIAASAQLPLPTVHRYVKELQVWGGLVRGPDGRFSLGLHLWQLGTKARWDRIARQLSAPVLDGLAKATGLAAAAMSYHNGRVVTVERRWGRYPETWINPIGSELPLPASTAGKLLLANAGDEQAVRILELVSPQSVVEIERDIERIKAQGYSMQVGLWLDHQGAISVPVPGPFAAELALTLVFPATHISHPEDHLDQLRLAAAQLSITLKRELAA